MEASTLNVTSARSRGDPSHGGEESGVTVSFAVRQETAPISHTGRRGVFALVDARGSGSKSSAARATERRGAGCARAIALGPGERPAMPR